MSNTQFLNKMVYFDLLVVGVQPCVLNDLGYFRSSSKNYQLPLPQFPFSYCNIKVSRMCYWKSLLGTIKKLFGTWNFWKPQRKRLKI